MNVSRWLASVEGGAAVVSTGAAVSLVSVDSTVEMSEDAAAESAGPDGGVVSVEDDDTDETNGAVVAVVAAVVWLFAVVAEDLSVELLHAAAANESASNADAS